MKASEKLRWKFGSKLEAKWKRKHKIKDCIPNDFYGIDFDYIITNYSGDILAIVEIKSDPARITRNEIAVFSKIVSSSSTPIFVVSPDRDCERMDVYRYLDGDPVFADTDLETIGLNWTWLDWFNFEKELRDKSKLPV